MTKTRETHLPHGTHDHATRAPRGHNKMERVFTHLREAYKALESREAMKPTYRVYDGKVLKMLHQKVYVAKADESIADVLGKIGDQKKLADAVAFFTDKGSLRFECFVLNEKAFKDMARTDATGAEFFSALLMEMFDSNKKGLTLEEISDLHRYKPAYVRQIIDTTMETVLIKV
ncbi:Uncharacterised protein [uncultured archaeon]|nr:Uncharacterised protein [uncultured archaeon]